MVPYKYWMDFDEGGKIILSDCSNEYCCSKGSLSDGCDYFRNQLCTIHRNASVPFCGKCHDGYSELLRSEACGICDGYRNLYILVPIV